MNRMDIMVVLRKYFVGCEGADVVALWNDDEVLEMAYMEVIATLDTPDITWDMLGWDIDTISMVTWGCDREQEIADSYLDETGMGWDISTSFPGMTWDDTQEAFQG